MRMIFIDLIFETCVVLDLVGFFLSKNIPPPDPHASVPVLTYQVTIPAPYQCRFYLSLSYKHRYTLADLFRSTTRIFGIRIGTVPVSRLAQFRTRTHGSRRQDASRKQSRRSRPCGCYMFKTYYHCYLCLRAFSRHHWLKTRMILFH
jgi:hypothetical protein